MEDLVQLYQDLSEALEGFQDDIKEDSATWLRLSLIPLALPCVKHGVVSSSNLSEEQKDKIYRTAMEHRTYLGLDDKVFDPLPSTISGLVGSGGELREIDTVRTEIRDRVVERAIDRGFDALKTDAEQPNTARTNLGVAIAVASMKSTMRSKHKREDRMEKYMSVLSKMISEMTSSLIGTNEKLGDAHVKLSEANEKLTAVAYASKDEWQRRAMLAEKQVAFLRRTLPAVYIPVTEQELDAVQSAFMETLPKPVPAPPPLNTSASMSPSELPVPQYSRDAQYVDTLSRSAPAVAMEPSPPFALTASTASAAKPKLSASTSSIPASLFGTNQIPVYESMDEEDEEEEDVVDFAKLKPNEKEYVQAEQRMEDEGGLPSSQKDIATPRIHDEDEGEKLKQIR